MRADVMMDCFCGAFRRKKMLFPSDFFLGSAFFCFIQQGNKEQTRAPTQPFSLITIAYDFVPSRVVLLCTRSDLQFMGEWGEYDPKQHPASTRIYFNVQPWLMDALRELYEGERKKKAALLWLNSEESTNDPIRYFTHSTLPASIN